MKTRLFSILLALSCVAGATQVFAMSSNEPKQNMQSAEASFQIRYDASKLRVKFGENFVMQLWAVDARKQAPVINWSIKAGSLPDGLKLLVSDSQRAAITGRIQFMGQWCLKVLAASASGTHAAEESFCIDSQGQEEAAPRMSPVILPQKTLGVSPGAT
jgi:hypothetical protein